MSEETYRTLENLTLSSDKGPLLEEWGSFYAALSKELGQQRSARLGRPYTAVFDKDPESAAVVSAALNAKDPLMAERLLLDHEFSRLDMMVGLHSFDDHVLFGYALKLKLLERVSCFEYEKGKKEFSDILRDLKAQVSGL